MKNLVKPYLLTTFGIQFLCWGGCAVCSARGVYLSEWPALYVLYFLGGFSPTIASFLALKCSGGVAGFSQWRRSVFDLRHSVFSYLLLVIFAGCFFGTLCLISGYDAGAPLGFVVFMIPMMLFGGGLEETGWRGILQPAWEKKFGFAGASFLTAAVWWLWHAPLFQIQGVSQYGADFLAFGIQVLGLSFALGAVRKVTGSVWLCVLLHCLINSLHGVYVIRENIWGSVAAAGVLILLSFGVVWAHNRKPIFT